jgi:hypothetical protein
VLYSFKDSRDISLVIFRVASIRRLHDELGTGRVTVKITIFKIEE